MCNTKLEEKTVEIVSKMFSWKTFDCTLLDDYFLNNDVEVKLIYSIHSYIFKNIGEDTFIFTNIFEKEFEKVVNIFKTFYFGFFICHSSKVKIDVMNLKNPILFESKSTQDYFIKCLKWEC